MWTVLMSFLNVRLKLFPLHSGSLDSEQIFILGLDVEWWMANEIAVSA